MFPSFQNHQKNLFSSYIWFLLTILNAGISISNLLSITNLQVVQFLTDSFISTYLSLSLALFLSLPSSSLSLHTTSIECFQSYLFYEFTFELHLKNSIRFYFTSLQQSLNIETCISRQYYWTVTYAGRKGEFPTVAVSRKEKYSRFTLRFQQLSRGIH